MPLSQSPYRELVLPVSSSPLCCLLVTSHLQVTVSGGGPFGLTPLMAAAAAGAKGPIDLIAKWVRARTPEGEDPDEAVHQIVNFQVLQQAVLFFFFLVLFLNTLRGLIRRLC